MSDQVPKTSVEQLAANTGDFDFLILGEMHGSKQNALLVQELIEHALKKNGPVTIAFEWLLTNAQVDELRSFVQGGEVPQVLPKFFLDSDGRFTYEHASLLKWIRHQNMSNDISIDITTFDTRTDAVDHDRGLAENLALYKKDHPGRLIVVETGVMHARKQPYSYNDATMVPMAALLSKEYSLYSVFLHYDTGTIDVEGNSWDVTLADSQIAGPQNFHDAYLNIPASEAATSPETLTSVTELLK